MSQFDVYTNPQPASRSSMPFVVDIQSPLIDQLPTRLVMPLTSWGMGQVKLPLNLCPEVAVQGEALTVLPHFSAPVPARLLKKSVASVWHRSSEIMAALDAVASGV